MLDDTDKKIVNALQAGFPLSERPFADAADQLGLSEIELMSRIETMLAGGELTRFGPMYNADRMGGAFCLCAMAVPEADFDKVSDCVNAFPEVAHNYARAHTLNMWFVLATETPERIAEVTAEIERATGLAVSSFPKLEEFFVGFKVAA